LDSLHPWNSFKPLIAYDYSNGYYLDRESLCYRLTILKSQYNHKHMKDNQNHMIRYSEIEHLPTDHPAVVAFTNACKDRDDCMAAVGCAGDCSAHDDEESLDHFNAYIAGDR
jgi:hypothetical protein